MALQLLLGPIHQRLVKRASVGQADVSQGFFKHVLVELLGADEFYVGNGRPLFNNDHQYVTVDFQAHILEQAQCKQRANG